MIATVQPDRLEYRSTNILGAHWDRAFHRSHNTGFSYFALWIHRPVCFAELARTCRNAQTLSPNDRSTHSCHCLLRRYCLRQRYCLRNFVRTHRRSSTSLEPPALRLAAEAPVTSEEMESAYRAPSTPMALSSMPTKERSRGMPTGCYILRSELICRSRKRCRSQPYFWTESSGH